MARKERELALVKSKLSSEQEELSSGSAQITSSQVAMVEAAAVLADKQVSLGNMSDQVSQISVYETHIFQVHIPRIY